MKRKNQEYSFNMGIPKRDIINKIKRRNSFFNNISIKNKISNYSFISNQTLKTKKIKFYSAYYKNIKNNRYNLNNSINNKDNNISNSLFNSIIKSFNIYSRNRGNMINKKIQCDSINETKRLINTANSLFDSNKIIYNNSINNQINKNNLYRRKIALKKNLINRNTNLNISNKIKNIINNKTKNNINNRSNLNINNKSKNNIDNKTINDINIYKFNIIPKYIFNNSNKNNKDKKEINKNYVDNNNYHIKKYKKKKLTKTISIKSKIKRQRRMNVISIELRKSKIISEEKIRDEDLINKFFNHKPLVIKPLKPSSSIRENKKMKKKCLVPFTNSFGPILNDVYNKANFLKGSLDFMYPKIIIKKFYEDKRNAIIRKIIQKEYERKKSKSLTEKYYILKDDSDLTPNRRQHFRLRSA